MNLEQAIDRTSGYAIASLVLGIAGLVFFPLVPSILAVVFGNKAREEIRRGEARGDGLAIAGVILGWVGIGVIALGILILLLVLALFAA